MRLPGSVRREHLCSLVPLSPDWCAGVCFFRPLLGPFILIVILLTACAKTPLVLVDPVENSGPSLPLPSPGDLLPQVPRETLQADLAHIFSSPKTDNAFWAVSIQSMDTGEFFYRLNSTKLVMPASNMKILTVAVAAEELGWDYQYETQLLASGQVKHGRLASDLIVRGNGDPTINSHNGPRENVFETWADQLKAMGIYAIDGRIVGDDNAFEDMGLAEGWPWEDLAYGYATSVGALQHHENVVNLVFDAGPLPGTEVSIKIHPLGSGLKLVNRVLTAPNHGDFVVNLHRLPGQATLEVTGLIPAGSKSFTLTASVNNPTQFFVKALHTALTSNGIEVLGPATDIDDITISPATDDQSSIEQVDSPHRVLISYLSPPLSEISKVLMKVSQNLYAETLLKTISTRSGLGTTASGIDGIEKILDSWDVSPHGHIIADGSGLSRYNYVSPEILVKVLHRMHSEPQHAAMFKATLPIAGREGTLTNRMQGTAAEGNVRAKTGSIANVRALSGYAHTRDDELLAFSIIVNNFDVRKETIDELIDQAVERLVNFSRL